MTITDEQLSAFLDGALPDAEMTAIRTELTTDEALQRRLETLALADDLVLKASSAIDAMPLPDGLVEKIEASAMKPAGAAPRQSVRASFWQILQPFMQPQLAATAAIALVAGFAVAELAVPDTAPDSRLAGPEIARILDQETSGENHLLADGSSVTPRLTFTTGDGTYCRQFNVSQSGSQQEALACQSGDGWELAAVVYGKAVNTAAPYQTASGSGMLDTLIDDMIDGMPLSRQEEQRAIAADWSGTLTENFDSDGDNQ